MALEWHPDKQRSKNSGGGNSDAVPFSSNMNQQQKDDEEYLMDLDTFDDGVEDFDKIFKDINEAYQILSDVDKRLEYDQHLLRRNESSASYVDPSFFMTSFQRDTLFDPFAIFEQFFHDDFSLFHSNRMFPPPHHFHPTQMQQECGFGSLPFSSMQFTGTQFPRDPFFQTSQSTLNAHMNLHRQMMQDHLNFTQNHHRHFSDIQQQHQQFVQNIPSAQVHTSTSWSSSPSHSRPPGSESSKGPRRIYF